MIEKVEIKSIKKLVSKIHAITNPRRVKILDLLLEHDELNVTQIYSKLQMKQADVSGCLKMLLYYKLVKKQRRKKMFFYSVETENLNKIIEMAEILNDENNR